MAAMPSVRPSCEAGGGRRLTPFEQSGPSKADVDSISPIAEDHIATGMTIRQLCDAAVRYSDGTAGNLLMRGSLAWLAVVNSIGALVLLFVLLRRGTGGAATSLLYLVPPVTAVLAVPILGQGITASVIAGMAVSGAGVLLVLVRTPR